METKAVQEKSGKSFVNDYGAVSFTCPVCKNTLIKRTSHERRLGAKYVCECGFSGPN